MARFFPNLFVSPVMRPKVKIEGDNHLATLGNCRGYYNCLKDAKGNRLGKLVAYAGKYDAWDGTKKQWVGDEYANFSKAEEHTEVLDHFGQCLVSKVGKRHIQSTVDIFCGAPIGGYSFSQTMARICKREVIKAEKKITALATPTSREQSELFFGRHSIEKDVWYAVVEDVCNNFSTTEELIKLICSLGGKVAGIFCFLNRSPSVDGLYRVNDFQIDFPVFSLERKVIDEYKQEDSFVVDDIAKGNVAWKPKDNWDSLIA